MIEWLTDIDKDLFIFLNHLRADWADPLMLFLSAKKVWIPLYALILLLIGYQFRKKSFALILALILSVVVADQITSGFMKPHFERYRPCHEPDLEGFVLTPGKCGGKYGFASSHAANTFALAGFMCFLFYRKNKWITALVFWALLVSYSRIYLGVHYPLDILTGAAIGIICGCVFYKTANIINRKIFSEN